MTTGAASLSHGEARVIWRIGTKVEANQLLVDHHYLGPIRSGRISAIVVGELNGRVVAAQVWRPPTSRRLPSDGSWLELSRWCLTGEAGKNAGSRQHAAAVRALKASYGVSMLVSYSDPSQGHTGALYRACNWRWAPTWHRLRPPPTGAGNWGTDVVQHVKDRWVFPIRYAPRDADLLMVNDSGAIRRWVATATADQLELARRSMANDLVQAVRFL